MNNSRSTINDLKSFLSEFDRFFLSPKCFEQDSTTLMNILCSGIIPEQSIVLNEETLNALKSKNPAILKQLNDAHLLRVKKGTENILVFNTNYLNASRKLADKHYRILLITPDETEGVLFKKLDYDDNRVNDLEACCIPSGGEPYTYIYLPPKENITFIVNVKVPCLELRVAFYKTTHLGKEEILYPFADIKTQCVKISPNKYEYIIDKAKLFDRDKLAFAIKKADGSGVIKTDNLSFFFGEDHEWTLGYASDGVHIRAELANNGGDSNNKNPIVFDETTNNDTLPNVNDEDVSEEVFNYYGGRKANLPEDVDITTKEPVEGEFVFNNKKQRIKLIKKLGEGGEGTVYATDDPKIVVKILNNRTGKNLTRNKKEKIEFMCSKPMKNDHVIWPKEAIYNSSNVFVGYSMAHAKGVDLNTIMTQIRPNEGFGILNMTKMQIVDMIISMLETMVYLHKRNILIGDIKPHNLMIKNNNPSEVFFVDCDSYQIDKFPSTKTTPGYMAPELIGVKVDKQYRTFGNENYALFALLLILLTKVSVPYSQQNADMCEIERAKHGLFPFFLDKTKTEAHAQRGYPQVNWSHLPSYIKKAFVNVGNMHGKNFGESKRVN